MNTLGTVSIGVRAPIIRRGDNLLEIVSDSVIKSVNENNILLNDRDVIAVTEAILARAQGNYATVDQIAKDVSNKFGDHVVGLIFPIMSRNRFSLLLKAFAAGVRKLIVQLSYPSDEVGNSLIGIDLLDELGIDPSITSFTEAEFRRICPNPVHPFTGIDYMEYYRKQSGNIEIVLSNKITEILKYSDYIINADIHSRARTKRVLLNAGAKCVYSLSEILTKSIDGSGFHPEFGLLGSNLSSENTVKLFPRDAFSFCESLKKIMFQKTGKAVECMVYGDGAFKDPVAGIWELADPVVSPGYTSGLMGVPSELKLKYIADNEMKDLTGENASEQIKKYIAAKHITDNTAINSQGTTPRRYVDLLGSLADLTSGSGDKGTPIVLIQNYFKNFSE